MRRTHDMGGEDAGSVNTDEREYEPWEKRVDAMVRLMSDDKRRVITVDEMRRAIEDLGPGVYDELSYYERWMAALTQNLLEKQVITIEELGKTMEKVQAEWGKND